MGLDMYLKKRTYIGNNYREAGKLVKVVVPDDQTGVMFPTPPIKDERVSNITEQVGYWRKANAIHNWFVENVQGSNDDCDEYPVSKEHLAKLLELVRAVLADRSRAAELLPTTAGFFFGSQEYDEYYFEDLKETEKILETALAEDGSYYYQSSW
jgi:hypothetical protein